MNIISLKYDSYHIQRTDWSIFEFFSIKEILLFTAGVGPLWNTWGNRGKAGGGVSICQSKSQGALDIFPPFNR